MGCSTETPELALQFVLVGAMVIVLAGGFALTQRSRVAFQLRQELVVMLVLVSLGIILLLIMQLPKELKDNNAERFVVAQRYITWAVPVLGIVVQLLWTALRSFCVDDGSKGDDSHRKADREQGGNKHNLTADGPFLRPNETCTLRDVLYNRRARAMFEQFLQREFSLENLLFYDAVNEFQKRSLECVQLEAARVREWQRREQLLSVHNQTQVSGEGGVDDQRLSPALEHKGVSTTAGSTRETLEHDSFTGCSFSGGVNGSSFLHTQAQGAAELDKHSTSRQGSRLSAPAPTHVQAAPRQAIWLDSIPTSNDDETSARGRLRPRPRYVLS